MPTYEYLCQGCGYKFEKFQNMNEEPIKVCPKCRGRLKRLISKGAGVIFKSRGSHVSDHENSDFKTCCGRTQPCNEPPCNSDGICRR